MKGSLINYFQSVVVCVLAFLEAFGSMRRLIPRKRVEQRKDPYSKPCNRGRKGFTPSTRSKVVVADPDGRTLSQIVADVKAKADVHDARVAAIAAKRKEADDKKAAARAAELAHQKAVQDMEAAVRAEERAAKVAAVARAKQDGTWAKTRRAELKAAKAAEAARIKAAEDAKDEKLLQKARKIALQIRGDDNLPCPPPLQDIPLKNLSKATKAAYELIPEMEYFAHGRLTTDELRFCCLVDFLVSN